MRRIGEPAGAAATITLAEGRGPAVEAAGEAILAVHDEPCRVSQLIQLTSELPMTGPPRSRAACAHPVSQPGYRLSSRQTPARSGRTRCRLPGETAARCGCRDRRPQLLIHKWSAACLGAHPAHGDPTVVKTDGRWLRLRAGIRAPGRRSRIASPRPRAPATSACKADSARRFGPPRIDAPTRRSPLRRAAVGRGAARRRPWRRCQRRPRTGRR